MRFLVIAGMLLLKNQDTVYFNFEYKTFSATDGVPKPWGNVSSQETECRLMLLRH